MALQGLHDVYQKVRLDSHRRESSGANRRAVFSRRSKEIKAIACLDLKTTLSHAAGLLGGLIDHPVDFFAYAAGRLI
jgi:hypothetical protein